MRLFAYATPTRSISRRRLQATFQCRHFHLLGATFPGNVSPLEPSRREILDFNHAANYEKPAKTHVNLRTYSQGKVRTMSLETALSKFAKPGKLLLPVPQPKKHKWNDRLYHYFKPIDIRSVRQHISPSETTSHEYHFFLSRADDVGLFENCMAEIFLLLLKGRRVEIQVHSKFAKDRNAFQNILNRKIYLRPDVILAAMPPPSRIIIEPHTNFEKVCWVMEGPFLHPKTLESVKPLSKMGEFYKRRWEVVRAVQSELRDAGILHMDQDTTNLLASPKASQEGAEAQAKLLPESLGSVPVPPALSTLSLEEQEMEDYRKLDEMTGFRPPEHSDDSI